MKKTSTTHPIQIATIGCGIGKGLIGISFCPGKKDDTAMTGSWDRDLATDLDAIQMWGAAAVITLLEDHELQTLRVGDLGANILKRGMIWHHLPIVDVSIPDRQFEQAWGRTGKEVIHLLERGDNVFVHCRGGLGRAGMIGARILVEMGHDPQTAMRQIRSVRPGAIETLAQERYVLTLKTYTPESPKHRG